MEGYTRWTSHGEEAVVGDDEGDGDGEHEEAPEAYPMDHAEETEADVLNQEEPGGEPGGENETVADMVKDPHM